MGQSWSVPKPPSSNSTQLFDSKNVPFLIAYDGAWFGMLCIAVTLLTLSALLAGLTLAVCGLDMTFLQLRSVTGTPKQRQQALVVARMKRHHSWMLCSLILLSVLCSESLPFVIQSLWDDAKQWWVPVIVSTLLIAFFAEIAPQYWIPRHAIVWGYYCWPLIWGCMWITGIISWPISKLLDHSSRQRDELSIFSNDELAGLIKYHERSKNHGGTLDQDTTRVLLGALSLDGHKVGSSFSPFPETRSPAGSKERDSDVEKADLVLVNGMIVNWSTVKTVNIDELVDATFIKKVKSWSYSRIPVVGEAQVEQAEPDKSPSQHSNWNAKKVFGVLHIKNLVGLKICDKHDSTFKMRVRDLQLYPLPIIRDDMLVYSLLNMFLLGMSKMAVVIPASDRTAVGEMILPKKSATSPPATSCWTGTERTNNRIKSRLRRMNARADWTKDFLDGALSGIENRERKHNVIGTRCPEPSGIITFEDIIDAILRKTSRDERDFYENAPPRTWGNLVDSRGIISMQEDDEKNTAIPAYVHDVRLSLLELRESNHLRKRNPSNRTTAAMDGADEHSVDATHAVKTENERKDYTESSYTQNSQGGLHGGEVSSSGKSVLIMTPEEWAALGGGPPPTPANPDLALKAAASLPSRKEAGPFLLGGLNPSTRRYVSAMPVPPTVRRVTPFSRQDCSSFVEDNATIPQHDESELEMPNPSMLGQVSSSAEKPGGGNDEVEVITSNRSTLAERFAACIPNINLTNSFDFDEPPDAAKAHIREDSSNAVSINSWSRRDPYEFEIEELNSRFYSRSSMISTLADIHGKQTEPPTPWSNVNDLHMASQPPVLRGLINDPNQATTYRAETYAGFPPELLDQTRENRIPDFASQTLPRILRFTRGLDGADDRRDSDDTPAKEDSFHDDRALLPSQKRALNGSMNLSGLRSTSFWF